MNTLIKLALSLVAFVVLLILVAVIVIPLFIDPNDYKPQIAALVKQHTAREVEIEGDLNLSVFPWIGIETGRISLGNAPGFGERPFADIEHTQIKVKLLPLLSKKIEVSRIVVQGLILNLARNKNGVSNWDDLTSKSKNKSGQESPKQQKSSKSEEKESTPANLVIGGIAVQDANIVWNDQSTTQHVEISNLDFILDQLKFDQPVDFDLGFILKNKEPDLTEKLNLSGNVSMNASFDLFKLGSIKLISKTEGKSVPGGLLEIVLMVSGDVNLKNQTTRIEELRFNAKNFNVTGELKGENILDAPSITGHMVIAQFSPRKLLKSLDFEVPITQDKNTLQKLQSDFQLKATNEILELNNLSILLDDTMVNGQTRIVDFSNPGIAFNFEIDAINADRYLPPKKETDPPPSSNTQKTSPSSIPADKPVDLPLETLRTLNLQGKVKISQLTLKGLKAQGVEFDIKGKNGLIASKQSVTNLYHGNYQGSLQIDARTDLPKLALTESLSNVSVEPLLRDATGKTPISGTLEFSAQLSGRGRHTDAIKSSLNGTINALFTDGAIQGINLIKMIRTAKTLLKKQPTQIESNTDKTEFSELKLSSNVNKGVVNTHELILKSPLLRVTGSGTANLISEEIDYRIATKLVGSLDGQGGAEIKDLKGIPIGVNIKGSISKPSFSLDLATSLTPKQKEKIEKKKQKLLDKLDKKLGPGTSDLLKQFF